MSQVQTLFYLRDRPIYLKTIPGLGPKRRRELLKQFGGLQGVRSAGIDDLVKVRGISRSLAEKIYNDLHLEGGT